MKATKFAAALLAAIMLVFTAGCHRAADPQQNIPTEAVTVQTEAPAAEQTEEPAEIDLDTLGSLVTKENAAEYDFTGLAMKYLNEIGTKYRKRSVLLENGDYFTAQEWIIKELKAAGYTDESIEKQEFKSYSYWGGMLYGCNIVLTKKGADDSRQIIVGAHYDGEGVGDNGSGTALLLATAVGLHGAELPYTVRFIFFDAEEEGLLGSINDAGLMTEEDIAKTIYMINVDSIAFGDYCNIYGGVGCDYSEIYVEVKDELPEPADTEAYYFAARAAEDLGMKVWRPKDLDGYFEEHGTGPDIEPFTLYTNPWTNAHPAPENSITASPSMIPASDHVAYARLGIQYVYFEACNWFAKGTENYGYMGYIETYDSSVGEGGMFMNTEYDTIELLESLFPGRAEEHFHTFSPLLSALLMPKA